MSKEIPWIKTAEELLHTDEIPGPKSNPKILQWAKNIGGWIAKFYTNDDIPWCGLFVAHCMRECGFKVPQDGLAAIAWSKYGMKQKKPAYGSIVVYRWGNGKHHVGFVVGENAYTYSTLGGNQSNSVTVAQFPKSRAISFTWPSTEIKPEPLK